MTDLEAVELFRGLEPADVQALNEIARERVFATESRIFSEGDPGDGVYVIREGLVEIAHVAGGRVRCVFSKLGPREIFGEMAVIEELPRSATATAVKETRVYFLPRLEMAALLRRSPTLSFRLLQEISRRLRDFDQYHLREIIQAERVAALGTFARSIVHDLRTPLTVIGLAAEITSGAQATAEQRRQCYSRINRQIARVNELIGDILDFTQSAPSDMTLPRISYHAFIQGVIADLRAEAELKGGTVNLENEPPDVKARIDGRRIRRVLFNLAGNALDMRPEGGQILLRFKKNGSEIITEMQDNGPGIAPQIADKLFQAFATYGKQHGTGLGLSICKKIIEDHGGRIAARNVPGGGAIFSFTLPLVQEGN